MDFGFDARTEELRQTLLAFMDEHVYPAEAVFDEQVAALPTTAWAWSTRPGARRSSRRRPASAGCGTSSCPASTAPG